MRSKTTYTLVTAAALALASFAFPAPATGQLANASASALALSGNNTALVRGFGAISVNPAGLAMPGSGFSLALVPIQLRAGLGPVRLSDLADFGGVLVPTATKEAWLAAIEAGGGQSGSAGLDISALALTIGNFGLQISSIASTTMNLPPDAAEAVLYGNAGRTGSATDLELTGLDFDAFAMTTAAVSWAFPLGSARVGATGKYTVGHGLAVGRSTSGAFLSNPLRLTLSTPIVASCDDEVAGACTQDFAGGGDGYGLDLGFMMQASRLTIGASIQNVINTFEWDQTTLSYRPGNVLLEEGTSESDFDETSYGSAPTILREIVEDFTLKPSVRLGAALELPMGLTVTGDIHRRLSDKGIAFGPRSHVGVGAEFRGLGILHLRGGAAVITDGTKYSGGASLVLGPINLSAAVALEHGDMIDEVLYGQFTFSLWNR